MNILLIGSGGREHALAAGLASSPLTETLFAFPGNPGIASIATNVTDLTLHDPATIIAFCKNNAVQFVVIGPEAPLVKGLADILREQGIIVFGPSAAAARIESSKGFAKELMAKYAIPTAAYRTFSVQQAQDAHEYIHNRNMPIVIKADGLAAGKGVIVATSHEEAHAAIDDMFSGLFADAGSSIVIEDFLTGEEASVFAISDGKDFVLLAPAQDHKRALDNDEGKNTGGMGAYAPAPIVTEDVLEKVSNRIVRPMLDAMNQEGIPFSGCLFVGLMIDKGEPSVVEFNCRFGDPETQAVLSVFEGDLTALLYSSGIGVINHEAMIARSNGFACNVVIASGGYPDEFTTGHRIHGLVEAEQIPGVKVFHAGTKQNSDHAILSAGGRVLGICAKAQTLSEAIDRAYEGVHTITFDSMYYRKDIGKKGLAVTIPS